MSDYSLYIATSVGLFVEQGGDRRHLLSGEVVDVWADPELLICARKAKGVSVSKDQGSTWVDHEIDGQSIVTISRHQDRPEIILAGTQPAGALISEDTGKTWRQFLVASDIAGTEKWEIPIRDPSKKIISESAGQGAAAWNVVFDPRNPNTIVIGVEVGGLLVSEDFGQSWEVRTVGGTPDPHVICPHPAGQPAVLISTGFSRFTDEVGVFSYSSTGGVYRSEHGFDDFNTVWPGDPVPQYTRAMCWDPRAPYPATVCVRSSYVQNSNPDNERRAVAMRSNDDGKTWKALGGGRHVSFDEEYSAVTPDPRAVGDIFVGTEQGRLFEVSAGGVWSEFLAVPARVNALKVVCLGE